MAAAAWKAGPASSLSTPGYRVGGAFHHSGPWWLGTLLLSPLLENAQEQHEFLHRFLIFGRSPGLTEPSLGEFSSHGGNLVFIYYYYFGLAFHGRGFAV